MKISLNTKKIKQWRNDRMWSQERLAAVSGISLRTVQRIENGMSASHDSAAALAAAFDVDIAALTLDLDHQIEKTKLQEEAKRALQMKMSFTIHLVSYLLVMGILVAVNLSTDATNLWILWPAIGWGIGLLAHGASAWIVSSVAKTNAEMAELD